jgi:hypothetical protein
MNSHLYFLVLASNLGELKNVLEPFLFRGRVNLGGENILVVRELDFSHSPFVSMVALYKEEEAENGMGRLRVFVPYTAIVAVLEMPVKKYELGFGIDSL